MRHLILALLGVISTLAALAAPATASEPDACVDLRVFVVAGTFAFNDIPQSERPAAIPTFVPEMMEQPVQDLKALTAGRADFRTIDYPASPNFLRSVPVGREQTMHAVEEFLARCPASRAALYGHSQGAWIVGDVATAIGARETAVDPARIAAVYLQADAFLNLANGQFVGPAVRGGVLGSRPRAFGALETRTFTFCARGDRVCDTTGPTVENLLTVAVLIGGSEHGSYRRYLVEPGTTVVEWVQRDLAQRAPLDPSFPVTGGIGDRWRSSGGASGPLGAALSTERPRSDGRGRYVRFAQGSIVWTPQTGAHALRGALYGRWVELGAERSVLGYPTSEQITDASGTVQRFENGTLRLPAGGDRAVMTLRWLPWITWR